MDWALLVEQIKSRETVGMAEAYLALEPQIRNQIRKQLGGYQLSDRTNEAFLGVIKAIREAKVRDPARLRGFVKTVVSRKVLEYIATMIKERRTLRSDEALAKSEAEDADPELAAMKSEELEFLDAALRGLRPREEAILRRFYLAEEPEDSIREDMHLTPNQFRLLKSRSLDRMTKVGERLRLYPGV
jgi:RNA polymerase sigma factor (sigma-70 family)